MTLDTILHAVNDSGIGIWMRESEFAFPAVESLHVLAIVVVVGTIAIIDLRLINVASRRCAVTEMARDVLPWTWVGFAVAAVTGVLMFTSNPIKYADNTFFLLKMVTILLAGINMAVFELLLARTMPAWDRDCPVPVGAKVAGTLSLVFWVSVVTFGRWIGFTLNSF